MRDHTNKTTYSGTVGTGKSYGTLTTGTGDAIGKVSDLKVTGEATIPGVRLWGHRINLAADDGIKCEECEMQEELPELMQMTNGFREVIYKMYVLGKFRQETCKPEFESDHSVIPDRTRHVGYDPSKVHWVDDNTGTYTRKLKLDNGYVITDGGVIYESTSPDYHTGDMVTDKEWMQMVRDAQDTGRTSIGDMSMMVGPDMHDDLRQDAGMSVDKSATTNITADFDDGKVDESMKEKFARKLCEKTGL